MLAAGVLASLLASSATAHPVAGTFDAIELLRVVDAYYHAVGENRLDEAMSFYHEDSPEADSNRRELVLDASEFLHRTATLSFTVIERNRLRAVAQATHLHRRIAGIKFLERRIEMCYVLRRQGASWKIWSRASRSL